MGPRGNSIFSSKADLEYFKLSYAQRFLAFFICIGLGFLSFFYSLMSLFAATYRPQAFLTPFVFSNICFFTAIGFIKGFKTCFRELNSKDKRAFTYTFITTTMLTFYLAGRFYLLSLLLIIAQFISFTCFAISFVPGGASGLTG